MSIPICEKQTKIELRGGLSSNVVNGTRDVYYDRRDRFFLWKSFDKMAYPLTNRLTRTRFLMTSLIAENKQAPP